MTPRLRTWALPLLGCVVACFDPTDTPSPGDGTGSSGTLGTSSASADDDGSTTGVADTSTGGGGSTSDGDSATTTATTAADESSTTGVSCVAGRDMCVIDEDCPVGTCVDCQCVYDYGPCDAQPCECVPPANSVCFEGGCFCYVPCPGTSSTECPVPSAASAVPVCAANEMMEYSCALTCGLTEDCPRGMSCVTVPDGVGVPLWDNSVCVFPS